MKRNGTLLNQKYRSLLVATLAMTASTYLSGILDGIMVGQILGTVELYAINLTTSIIFLRSIPIARASATNSPPTRCSRCRFGQVCSPRW